MNIVAEEARQAYAAERAEHPQQSLEVLAWLTLQQALRTGASDAYVRQWLEGISMAWHEALAAIAEDALEAAAGGQ